MIDLYTDTTPNGYKISIMLEEIGLPYTPHHVDIGTGDQFKPEFLSSAPTTRSPPSSIRTVPAESPTP
jgi:GST-like protein